MVIDSSATLRNEWAAALADQLADKEMSRKDLWKALLDAGHEVSIQAVHSWCGGTYAPTPFHQAAIATVLNVPHRLLFPMPAVLARKETPAPTVAVRRGPRRRVVA